LGVVLMGVELAYWLGGVMEDSGFDGASH
jgi:hypothetical protein